MAEGSANIWGIQLTGKNPRPSSPVGLHVLQFGRHRGAPPAQDGLFRHPAFPSGVLGTPVEVVESLGGPLLIERKAPARRIRRRRTLPGAALGQGDRVPGAIRRAGHVLGPVRPDPPSRPRDSSAALPGLPGQVLINGRRRPANPEGRADATAG